MRKIDWRGDFNFGDEYHRETLTNWKDFVYGHFSVGPGAATVAAGRIGDKLYYGITYCSPQDNFSRDVGREYAKVNLMQNELSHMRGVLQLDKSVEDAPPAIVLKKVVEIHLNKHRPHWARGATVDFRTKRRHAD